MLSQTFALSLVRPVRYHCPANLPCVVRSVFALFAFSVRRWSEDTFLRAGEFRYCAA